MSRRIAAAAVLLLVIGAGVVIHFLAKKPATVVATPVTSVPTPPPPAPGVEPGIPFTPRSTALGDSPQTTQATTAPSAALPRVPINALPPRSLTGQGSINAALSGLIARATGNTPSADAAYQAFVLLDACRNAVTIMAAGTSGPRVLSAPDCTGISANDIAQADTWLQIAADLGYPPAQEQFRQRYPDARTPR
jgi:hypothetical protein